MIVAVEGSIGSGKSSMLRNMAKMGYLIVTEPLDAWSYWLEGNGDRAFFQCMVLAWYIARSPPLTHNGKDVIIERSPYTSKHVFTTRSVDLGDLQPTYDRLFNLAQKRCPISMYIFLVTSPSVCLKRIRRRGQAGDDGITIGYLRSLDIRHWRAITALKRSGKDVYVL